MGKAALASMWAARAREEEVVGAGTLERTTATELSEDSSRVTAVADHQLVICNDSHHRSCAAVPRRRHRCPHLRHRLYIGGRAAVANGEGGDGEVYRGVTAALARRKASTSGRSSGSLLLRDSRRAPLVTPVSEQKRCAEVTTLNHSYQKSNGVSAVG